MESSRFPYLKDQAASDWLAELGRKLECPVCLKTFTDSPIFVCENQHAVCSTCHTRLKAENKGCPQCRGRLTNKQNLVVEGILDTLPKKKCKYECEFKKTDTELVKEHEENCLAKPVPCGWCEEKIPMRDISKHIIENHYNNFVLIEGAFSEEFGLVQDILNLEKDLEWNIQSPLKVSGKHFIFNMTEYDQKHVLSWFSYCGGPNQAKEYKYKIKILDPDVEDPDVDVDYLSSHTSKCVSCELSFQEMRENSHGAAVISKEFLKSAAKENEFRYAITISKQ